MTYFSILYITVLSATSLTAKYTNGQSLTNPDNIEENSEITLECNFDEHDNSITRLVYLGTGDASEFVYQVWLCIITTIKIIKHKVFCFPVT